MVTLDFETDFNFNFGIVMEQIVAFSSLASGIMIGLGALGQCRYWNFRQQIS